MYQPLEDVLDYPSFSIKLGVKDIPVLLEILEAVPQEEIDRFRRKMWVNYSHTDTALSFRSNDGHFLSLAYACKP